MAIAAAVAAFVGIGFMIAQSIVSDTVERIRASYFPPNTERTSQNGIWSSRAGEWVLFAANSEVPASAYYFQPSSVRRLGDAVVYTVRFPLRGGSPTPADATLPQPTYEDNVSVIDCKKSTFALVERIVYSKSGAVLSRFNFGDPQTLAPAGSPVAPGAIASGAKRLLCDDLNTPVLTRDSKLSYLTRTPRGDGNIYYAKPEPV